LIDPRLHGRIDIKADRKERMYGLNSSCSGQGPIVGCCAYGNEHLDATKGKEFLEQFTGCQILRGLLGERNITILLLHESLTSYQSKSGHIPHKGREMLDVRGEDDVGTGRGPRP
jgi:hypothetical protein